MLTDDLDIALARSTTPAIDAELVRMAHNAERMSRPSFIGRFGRRGATFAIAGILLVGGGGAAAAATSDLWFRGDWSAGDAVELSDGTPCQVAFEVALNPDQTPSMDPVSVAARRYLKTLDLSTMLTPDVTSSADCSAQADHIGQTVNDKVISYLKAEGYDPSHLWTAVGAHWDPKR